MIPYFAQKTLIASLLKVAPTHIRSITVAEQWAIVAVKGHPYPSAIRLLELEAEHDRQRRERGRELPILAVDPETGATYFGHGWPASLHQTSLSECDCRDWENQKTAGRDRPFCKHMAALAHQHEQAIASATEGNRYRVMDDQTVATEAAIAYAELF